MQKPVGDFTAEMLYGVYTLRVGQTVEFAFDLYNVSSDSYGPGNPIDYSTVTATLRDGKNIVFQKTIPRQDFGETNTDISLPKKRAAYEMDLSYMKDDHEIAAASFPVRVGIGGNWRTLLTSGTSTSSLYNNLTIDRH